jgi:hypothetical protein
MKQIIDTLTSLLSHMVSQSIISSPFAASVATSTTPPTNAASPSLSPSPSNMSHDIPLVAATTTVSSSSEDYRVTPLPSPMVDNAKEEVFVNAAATGDINIVSMYVHHD